MSREKVTPDEARALLAVCDGRVHTSLNPGAGMFLGADWDEADAIAFAEKHGMEKAGPAATAMKHGLCGHDGSRWVFFATIGAVAPDEEEG